MLAAELVRGAGVSIGVVDTDDAAGTTESAAGQFVALGGLVTRAAIGRGAVST